MSYYDTRRKFEELQGKTLVAIIVTENKDEIEFVTDTKEIYKLFHAQECCECVVIDDIIGDLNDLLGTPILLAEEVSIDDTHQQTLDILTKERKTADFSYTWTFYKLSTIKGSVTLRWFGESNGYYSESVDFIQIAWRQ